MKADTPPSPNCLDWFVYRPCGGTRDNSGLVYAPASSDSQVCVLGSYAGSSVSWGRYLWQVF